MSENQSATSISDEVNRYLDAWAPHCGSSREVFEGQFKSLLTTIFDSIEEKAEANMMKSGKLEGMHYAALKDLRTELKIPRKVISR